LSPILVLLLWLLLPSLLLLLLPRLWPLRVAWHHPSHERIPLLHVPSQQGLALVLSPILTIIKILFHAGSDIELMLEGHHVKI